MKKLLIKLIIKEPGNFSKIREMLTEADVEKSVIKSITELLPVKVEQAIKIVEGLTIEVESPENTEEVKDETTEVENGNDTISTPAEPFDNTEEVKPEEVKPEEVKPEEVKPEEVKTDSEMINMLGIKEISIDEGTNEEEESAVDAGEGENNG